MADITFDLATKVVAKDQVIWAVFPGKYRRFVDMFKADRVIFLDLPGIKLSPTILADDDLLRQHISMSQALSDYRRGVKTSPPSRSVTSYKVERSSSTVGIIRSMYQKMKVGDLVLIGGKSLYEPFMAGEITSAFDPKEGVALPMYNLESVPVRNVRWLNVRTERRLLSQKLSRLLSNRNAVITLPKVEFGDEIYRIVYGDFVFGEDGRYVFPGPKYNNIARSTIPGIDLLSFFIAAFHAYDEKELSIFAELSIEDGISQYFEQDILRSFELEFASPGAYVIYSRRAALPLLAALLVAATAGTMTFKEASAAQIVNSADHTGPGAISANSCPVEIEEKYREIMKTMGAEKFNKLCDLNKEAQAGVGLRTNVKTKKH